MKYYIGVDGGGTKTAFALFDENKTVVESCFGSASNHENMEGSFSEAASVIMDGICALLTKANKKLSDISGILMGLAGIDHPYQHDAMVGELSARGLKNFRIYNDGFIVIKAGVGAGAGIGYNCGTGTCCNSVDSTGEMLQIGGFGPLSGDKGNGHWVAEQSFKAVYDELCLGKTHSMITDIIKENLGVSDRDGLLALIGKLETEEGEKIIRVFIGAFFEAANNSDEAALKVIDEMAERGADFICGHLNKMKFTCSPIPVVLSGSMHTALPSDIYIDKMHALCEARSGKKLQFIKLGEAPVTGCINWLLED